MNLIHLARELRSRGWSRTRHSKGRAIFGIRFPNGFGVTRMIDLRVVAQLQMRPFELADYITLDATLSARGGFRSEGAR